jgi:hypothetical protein
MILSLLVAGFAALAQSVPVQTVVASRGDDPAPSRRPAVDSLRAIKTAHRAQEKFEFVRKQNLPREFGVGSHHCDVHVGRWCVWNDETNDRQPPVESRAIVDARDHLLAVLDTVGSWFPSDEWVASQQVRYLVEAKRYARAREVAERCTASGSAYFCRALAGVAMHDSGAVAAADSAFTAALAAMPDSTRCKWLDIELLLDDDIADRFSHADCEGKARIAESFWRLTNPLYLRPHDFRNEFLARVTATEMQKNSRTPMGSPTESAFRETALRYGYDTWFVRDDPPAGSMDVPVAGYREGGSGFNFVPDGEAFASPAELQMEDWDLGQRTARTLYGPSYARHFKLLTGSQISLFRRGDSALVVTTYDVSTDTLFAHQSLEAGVFAVPVVDSSTLGEPVGATAPNAETRGVLATTAPWTPMVVSVELLDTKSKSAMRTRVGVRPPSRMRRVGVSDLFMFGPPNSDALPSRLEDALRLALYSDHIRRDQLLGLFWETYGVSPKGEHFDVAISVERIKEGWVRRAAERLHMATPFSPMKLQWTEMPDRGNGVASRSVTLNLSQLEPGRYEITLTVTPPDELPVIAKRQVSVDR